MSSRSVSDPPECSEKHHSNRTTGKKSLLPASTKGESNQKLLVASKRPRRIWVWKLPYEELRPARCETGRNAASFDMSRSESRCFVDEHEGSRMYGG